MSYSSRSLSDSDDVSSRGVVSAFSKGKHGIETGFCAIGLSGKGFRRIGDRRLSVYAYDCAVRFPGLGVLPGPLLPRRGVRGIEGMTFEVADRDVSAKVGGGVNGGTMI